MEARAQQGLPREALYLPFEAGPHRMLMGLVARHPDELIPGAAARLAEALRALPASMAAYKSLPPFRDALLSHLHAVSQA